MRRRKEKKGVKVVCECMEGGARFCCSVREHVWIMPAVIYMRGRARVRKWASMKGKDCVYVVRVCMCECVLMHVRKLWCPWLSSVYWQEMFVQAKRKKSCRPTWQTLGQGIHTRTCIDAHAGMYTRTHACKERFKKKKGKEKKEESDERSSLCGEVWYLVLGKWEWLGWARPVLYFPPPWLPTQAPADRKSIRWPPLNLCEWAQGLTALSTLMHTNWPTSLLQLLFLLLPLR